MATVPIRVLWVEDEPSLLEGPARYLALDRYVVVGASSGKEALQLLEAMTFDVVVSDIRVPEMDARALLRAIRLRDPDLPVIFMTGSPTLETAIKALAPGAHRYLMKPLDAGTLQVGVERAAQLHRLAVVRRLAAEELVARPGRGVPLPSY